MAKSRATRNSQNPDPIATLLADLRAANFNLGNEPWNRYFKRESEFEVRRECWADLLREFSPNQEPVVPSRLKAVLLALTELQKAAAFDSIPAYFRARVHAILRLPAWRFQAACDNDPNTPDGGPWPNLKNPHDLDDPKRQLGPSSEGEWTWELVARPLPIPLECLDSLEPPSPLPAPWFEEATGEALKAHALRHTTKQVTKIGKGRNARFCPWSVAHAYPDHADLIFLGLQRIR